MFGIMGYSDLLMNSLLVESMLVNPPKLVNYNSFNDMLPDITTTDLNDFQEAYSLDISPEAYKLSIIDQLQSNSDWLSPKK